MTQQPSKLALPPTPTVYSRPVRFLVVGLLAIMAFGLGNIIHTVRHPPKSFSALKLQQHHALGEPNASQVGQQPQEGARHNADR